MRFPAWSDTIAERRVMKRDAKVHESHASLHHVDEDPDDVFDDSDLF